MKTKPTITLLQDAKSYCCAGHAMLSSGHSIPKLNDTYAMS